jgi:alkylation response protein AidB-like acyl-CoA dehydrogenase
MRISLTEEQQQLRSALHDLFAHLCPPSVPRAVKDPSSDGVPAELWRGLAAGGVLGLAVDPGYDGQGAGLYELGLAFLEAGRVLCPTVVYSTLQFGVALDRWGTEGQKKEYLPALAAGRLRATLAVANPSDAGDVRPPLTAERTTGGYRLRGRLLYVPDAAVADTVLVTATTAEYGAPARSLAFLVDPAALTIRPLTSFAGDKQAEVMFDDVFCAEAATMAGRDGAGIEAGELRWVSNATLALQCMEMVGGASAVVDRTVEYTKMRHQFGRPIASFQAAQHLAADMWLALQNARMSAHAAMWWISRGDTATRAVAIANMHCSAAYKQISWTAHQLHGGMGFVKETDLHLWSERAKITEVRGGSADVAARWLQAELGLLP